MKDSKNGDISNEKVSKIEERLSNLSKKQIDELFHRVGFKVAKSKESQATPRKYQRIDNKALTPHQLEKIKGKDSNIVENMLLETPLDIVLTNLKELEKSQK